MKKTLSAILSLLIIASNILTIPVITASAATKLTEGFYTYEISNGEATITDCDTSISGEVTIPSTLGGYPVTTIGSSSFFNCTEITKIVLPEGITRIDMRAFAYNTNLKSINIPDSLSNFTLSAIEDCPSIETIVVKNSHPSYSSTDNVLFNKDKTTLIRFPESKSGSYTVPNTVTTIGQAAFADCKALTSITLPSGLTSIDAFAFAHCSALTSISIPYGVTSINYSTFRDCSELKNITIPNSVTTLSTFVFLNCSKLEKIVIPDSVTSIEDCCFINCTALSDVTLSKNLKTIKFELFWNCPSLETIVIPDSVTTIESSAFLDCSKLTTVVKPNDSINIADDAFKNCPNVTFVKQLCNTHSWSDWSATKAAGCEDKGTDSRSCTLCGKLETRESAALGHDLSVKTITKSASCTENGSETIKCSRCSESKTNEIKATGHSFGKWQTKTAATCTSAGKEERRCSACNEGEYRDIKKLGHDFEDPKIVRNATLTDTGLIEGKCKRCNETTSEIIPCSAKDETTGLSIEAKEGSFLTGSSVKFNSVSKDSDSYETIKASLSNIGSDFTAYNISFDIAGKEVLPTDDFTLCFPTSLANENIAICHISSDGKVTEKKFYFDGKELSVDTIEAGTYAVVNKSSAVIGSTHGGAIEENPNGNTFPWVAVIIAAVVVIAGAVAGAIIIIKKKKAA